MTTDVLLPLVITDAGRAALVNAKNTGSSAVTIAEVAVGSGLWSPTSNASGLKNEIKRVTSFGGDSIAPDTIHVSIQDYTTDEYTLGEFGLYTDTGVLFAIYSQTTPILEKDAAGIILLAADLIIESPDAQSVVFTGGGISLPPATPTVMGLMFDAPDDENVWGRYKGEWVKVWETGDVKMFSGTRANIETGWTLMDGTGHLSDGRTVPDIRDRFIIASGAAHALDTKGGDNNPTTKSAGAHSHSVTVNSGGAHNNSVTVDGHTLSEAQMPSHAHKQVGGGYQNGGASGAYGDGGHHNTNTSVTGGSQSHKHNASSGSAGSHAHEASSGSAGSHSHTVAIEPEFYALAFIIKL